MPQRLNSIARQQLIDSDLAWLRAQPRTLERDHIEDILMVYALTDEIVHAARELFMYERANNCYEYERRRKLSEAVMTLENLR